MASVQRTVSTFEFCDDPRPNCDVDRVQISVYDDIELDADHTHMHDDHDKDGEHDGRGEPVMGLHTWPCAIVLAEYIWKHRHDMLRNSIVWELGAGQGIPGMLACKCGANVVLTDRCDLHNTLSRLRDNCTLNGFGLTLHAQAHAHIQSSIAVRPLTWGTPPPDLLGAGAGADLPLPLPNIVIGSDVLYDEDVFDPLFCTVAFLMGSTRPCKFITSYQVRDVGSLLKLKPYAARWGLRMCENSLFQSFTDSFTLLPTPEVLKPTMGKHKHRHSDKEDKMKTTVSTPISGSMRDSTGHHGSRRKRSKIMSGDNTNSALQAERESLPIHNAKEKITSTIKKYPTTVLVGETGSGCVLCQIISSDYDPLTISISIQEGALEHLKYAIISTNCFLLQTTQIPQYLIDMGVSRRAIAITQPRRVAAITVAKRVATERNGEVGGFVGYNVRFDDCSSKHTRIRFVTDGMLLMEAMQDPNLARYDVVILDEAHERTLATDILFGVVRRIQETVRPDLKIVVMSATLEAEKFSNFFPNSAPLLYVEGRQHKVDVMFTEKPEEDFLDAALLTVLQIHLDEAPGDVLVFLSGQDDIESLQRLLEDRIPKIPEESQKLMVVPLFAALPPDQQLKVFDPAPLNTRKVILATNIAETSITIKNVRYVLDTGVVKARIYNSKNGIDALQVVPVSKASAEQRCGRAGREGPGKCFRLYTEDTYASLDDHGVPEIRRVNLSEYVLKLKALGIDDVIRFKMVDTPPVSSLIKAMETLYALGALDDTAQLTKGVGERMAKMPLDPMGSRSLLAAGEFKCLKDVLSAIAMLYVDNVFFIPRGKKAECAAARRRLASHDGDHLTYLHIYNTYSALSTSKQERAQWCRTNYINMKTMSKVVDVRKQLADYCKGFGLDVTQSTLPDTGPIKRALLCGYLLQSARKQPDGSYMTHVDRQIARIHPSSVLAGWHSPEYILYNELVLTTKKYLRDVTALDQSHLLEYGINTNTAVSSDDITGASIVSREHHRRQTSTSSSTSRPRLFTPSGKLSSRKLKQAQV